MSFINWLENEGVNPFPNSKVQYMVYHGTNKQPFDKFSYQKSKRFILFSSFDVETHGFFFSESPHEALEFGKNVIACYINLTNPLLDPRRDKHLAIDRLPYRKEIDLQKILAPMIEKDEYGHFIDIGTSKNYIKTRYNTFGHQWIYNAVSNNGLSWDALDNPGVVSRMIKLGYDGTFVDEPKTNLGRSIFIPSPDQVHMVKWHSGPQDSWGHKDDYYTSKKDGYSNFYSPETN